LVVPLPGLVRVVPPLGGGIVPHVPLVEPFAELEDVDAGVLAELRAFFADVVPFPFTLTDITEFPGGSTYLTPEPAAPFRRLTHAVVRLFPEVPRQRGAFDLVPHLTVPDAAELSLEALREDFAPWLPVTAMAREAALWSRQGDARTVATFPFGTSAA
jgi:hypothetical protein